MDIGVLNTFSTQIIFEFHGCNLEESEGFAHRKGILERLNECFVSIHTHLNNHGKIFYARNLFWSTTVEVSYLRRDLAQEFLLNRFCKQGFLEGLDAPTVLDNSEIPLRFEQIES